MKQPVKVVATAAVASPNAAASYAMPVLVKVGLVGLCSLTISASGIIMRMAERGDTIPFSPTASTFFAEAIKLAISLVLVIGTALYRFVRARIAGGGVAVGVPVANRRPVTASTFGWLLIPAIVYVVANNMRFYIAKAVNPGLLQVFWNIKIAVVGVLYQCPPFSRKLSARQWVGASLLVLGATVADLSQILGDGEEGEVAHDGDGDGDGDGGGGGSSASEAVAPTTAGLLLVGVGLVVTSFGAISCEYAYKHTAAELDFTAQCCILYGYGTVLNLLAFVARERMDQRDGAHFKNDGVFGHGDDDFVPPSFPKSLVTGFDAWAWATVLSMSVTGFLVGMIFKYIDSVAQVYSDMTAMFVTAGFAWFLFGLRINISYVGALVICALSLLTYYGVIFPNVNSRDPASGKENDSDGSLSAGSGSAGSDDDDDSENYSCYDSDEAYHTPRGAVERSRGEEDAAEDEEDGRGITLVPLLSGGGGGSPSGGSPRGGGHGGGGDGSSTKKSREATP